MKCDRILISRTDSIGDVVLTLPLAVALKKKFPSATIIFLGQAYTRPVIERCPAVDIFEDIRQLQTAEDIQKLNLDVFIHVFPNQVLARLAKKARVPLRIGTSHRLYHWTTCNKLLPIGRKNSDLHEAQLNLQLGVPLGLPDLMTLDEINAMTLFKKEIPPIALQGLIDPERVNLILHPTSKGSAREWGLDNFSRLVALLPHDQFRIFITGTASDGEKLKDWIHKHNNLEDLTGKLSLPELISFIAACDVLVAASTGPLHLAAASGIYAFGIYAPLRPIHAGRWAPLGMRAKVFSIDKDCKDCKKSPDCACIRSIMPATIAQALMNIKKLQ
ncbi:MAG: glycosyl transferase family 9 [Terrimonas sp.]|nr:glycosyl transferase family 9 [Terrimonas sp.]